MSSEVMNLTYKIIPKINTNLVSIKNTSISIHMPQIISNYYKKL